jgi:maltose O-acetyltransferase
MQDQLHQKQTLATRVNRLIHEEFGSIRPRLILIETISNLLPAYALCRVRTTLLRLAGFQIGHGTLFWGSPRISGTANIYRKLTIGERCGINFRCFFDLHHTITIGDQVSIGHEVFFLTSSHAIGPAQLRAGPLTTAPIAIEQGAWIGARSIILPGVTVGSGCVIAAGSIVTKDTSPNTLVGGVPARPLRALDETPGRLDESSADYQ